MPRLETIFEGKRLRAQILPWSIPHAHTIVCVCMFTAPVLYMPNPSDFFAILRGHPHAESRHSGKSHRTNLAKRSETNLAKRSVCIVTVCTCSIFLSAWWKKDSEPPPSLWPCANALKDYQSFVCLCVLLRDIWSARPGRGLDLDDAANSCPLGIWFH